MHNESQIKEKCLDVIAKLKAAREKKGISTYQLAEITGLKQSNISRLEQGDYMPNLLTLMRYAEGLGVEITIK